MPARLDEHAARLPCRVYRIVALPGRFKYKRVAALVRRQGRRAQRDGQSECGESDT